MIDIAEIHQRLEEVMGPPPSLPVLPPLAPEVLGEFRDGSVTRQLVTFCPEPDNRCFAWLLFPSEAFSRPRPAVLCLHQTVRCGKDEPAGCAGSPNLHYGRELAERGYVTLCPDYPGYGQCSLDPYALGYASKTMKGIWNHRRAVDFLTTLPEVDDDRIGCIGHSLGGHNSLFVAAYDPRIRAVATSCGFTRFSWNQDGTGNLSDWSHRGYMPRIAERYDCRSENMPFDFPDVLRAIAPRPVFINAPTQDYMRIEGVQECVDLVRPEYQDFPDRLVVVHPEGEHDFPLEAREEAWKFFDCFLGQCP